MKKFFLILSLALVTGSVSAQGILFHEKVDLDSVTPKHGPNYRNFDHYYMGFGLLLDMNHYGAFETNTGKSNQFVFGFRHKTKINNHYAVGYDLSYNSTGYSVKQTAIKTFPSGTNYKSERLVLRNLRLELYNRINFGRRGNKVGRFLDIGAFGEYGFANSLVVKTKLAAVDSLGSSRVKMVFKKPVYLNPFNYGASVRVGFNRYVLYATYRLSEMFKTAYPYPETANLIVGFQLGFH